MLIELNLVIIRSCSTITSITTSSNYICSTYQLLCNIQSPW